MIGEIKVTTPADPEKLRAYKKSKDYNKVKTPKLDKMGRRKGESVKMTEERANAILDKRQSAFFRKVFRED